MTDNDKSFRVLLDLTALRLENLRKVWINVSPHKINTISDFKKDILKKINLKKDVQLFSRDALLLDKDTIVILKEDDTVKVSSNENGCNLIEQKSEKDKRKKQIDSVENSTNLYLFSEEQETKQKESLDFRFTSIEIWKRHRELPSNSDNQPSKKRRRRNRRKKSSNSLINFANSQSTLIEDNQNHKESSKKKEEEMSVTYNETTTHINLCKTNDSYNTKNKSFSDNPILCFSHDRFEDSNCLNDANEICNTSETFVSQEYKFADVQSQDYHKMLTPVPSNNCDAPDLQLSIMPRKYSISSCNEGNSKQNEKEVIRSTTAQNNIGNKSGEQFYKGLRDVNVLPLVGTHMAYKVLELDETYTPVFSKYREGIVEKIDPDTDEMTITLKEPVVYRGKASEIENLGTPEPAYKICDVLSWDDLISPKRLPK